MRAILNKLSDAYAKYYNSAEPLSVTEFTVLFRGRAIFRQFMPKKCKHFGTEVYKLCDCKGYTCNMTVYLGKDWKCVTAIVTTTQFRQDSKD
jgi:hypothetical protein